MFDSHFALVANPNFLNSEFRFCLSEEKVLSFYRGTASCLTANNMYVYVYMYT